MPSKIRKLYPTPENPSITAGEAVPIGWVLEWYKKQLTRMTEQEADTALVSGFAGITVEFQDDITPEEATRDELVTLRAKLDAVSHALPREGETLSADQVAALRELLAG